MTAHHFTFQITDESDASDIREVETRAFGFSKRPLYLRMKARALRYRCWPDMKAKPSGIFYLPGQPSKGKWIHR